MEPIRIFLSYAREDYAAVRRLYDQLKAAGYQPWMDKVDLLKGDDFEIAIPQVIRATDFFIVCLSTHSVEKNGYLQKEIKIALEEWEKKSDGKLYYFPIRLEQCKVPERISKFNWTDLFGDQADEELEKLIRSLREGAARLGKGPPTMPPAPLPVPDEPTQVEFSTKNKPPDPPVPTRAPIVNPSAERQPEETKVVKAEAGDEPPPSVQEGRKTERPNTQVSSQPPVPPSPPVRKTLLISGIIVLIILIAVVIKQYTGGGQPEPNPSPKPTATTAPSPESHIPTITEDLGNGVKLEMVELPGDTFQMGSEAGSSDEVPVHQVTVSAFAIGKYEVTQAQWHAVTGNNPSSVKGDDLPVEYVSWAAAAAFCRELSRITGKSYRLPTEAEWEYACRAGTKGPFAGLLDNLAWYRGNAERKKHPGGQKQPNAFGLYNMHGNIAEWCHDWYGVYSSDDQKDPMGPQGGEYRVVRGGSFEDHEADCRSSNRSSRRPNDYEYYIGFRVVQSVRTP